MQRDALSPMESSISGHDNPAGPCGGIVRHRRAAGVLICVEIWSGGFESFRPGTTRVHCLASARALASVILRCHVRYREPVREMFERRTTLSHDADKMHHRVGDVEPRRTPSEIYAAPP